MFRKTAAAPERKRSNTGITATARARFMRISIHISLLADMYDFQGKTCPCIESVRAGFGKKGLEATVGLLQGPVNGRAQQRSAERKEQEADAEQPAFGARSVPLATLFCPRGALACGGALGPGNVWRGRTLFAGEAIRLSLP